jgi:DNA-binding CsgD family transcriptional regulator
MAWFGARHGLSKRECLVVRLTAQGHATKDTALAMGCEVATVNAYWLRIRRKTGLGSRLEVMATLLRMALHTSTGGVGPGRPGSQ